MISNIQLAEFCRKVAKSVNGADKLTEFPTLYMWGTYGKPITESLIKDKAKQYPQRYSAERQKTLSNCIGKSWYGCDCAGLIKWALWTNCNPNATPKYNAKTDRGTGGLWDCATQRGSIKTIPNEQGLIVYKSGHVGVYLGNGEVCECTLGTRGDGVVITSLNKGGWTYWLRIPEIMYVHGNDAKPSVMSKILTLKERFLKK